MKHRYGVDSPGLPFGYEQYREKKARERKRKDEQAIVPNVER
jgi:hypothetical protein